MDAKACRTHKAANYETVGRPAFVVGGSVSLSLSTHQQQDRPQIPRAIDTEAASSPSSSAARRPLHLAPHNASPISPSLRLQTTDLLPATVTATATATATPATAGRSDSQPPDLDCPVPAAAAAAAAAAGMALAPSASPSDTKRSPDGSTVSASSSYSPGMDAITRMTPLPSPLASCDSPGPWNQFRGAGMLSRNPSLSRSSYGDSSGSGSGSGGGGGGGGSGDGGGNRGNSRSSSSSSSRGTSVLVAANGETLDVAFAAQNQRKAYHHHHNIRPTPPPPPQHHFSFTNGSGGGGGGSGGGGGTGQKLDFESTLPIPIRRSLSRNGHERSPSLPVLDSSSRLHREKCLAQRRRSLSSSADSSPYLSGSVTSLSSVSSVDTVDPDGGAATPGAATAGGGSSSRLIKKQRLESFEARSVRDGSLRRLRGLRLLGQGAFSKVILATSENIPDRVDHVHDGGVVVDAEAVALNPRKYVAVKIIEHGAAGAESKERVESGLKREIDILKSVHHPCLVRLKAISIEPTRALLVLNFCAGGDLFDVASDYSFRLQPPLIRRIFAEIVSAVRYLHQNGIVHRDVKLENVLINLTRPQLAAISDSPYGYPHPITTLTDVGLSRRVDFDRDDLLTTRCGSDDYASPELIMGMPYDGRQTDAWALGVLLYALLEGRLPFDPPPASSEQKMRSKTAHRIARCEWKWIVLAPTPSPKDPRPGGGNLEVEVNGVTTTSASAAASGGYDERLEGGKKIVAGLMKRALKRWKLDAVADDEWVRNALAVPIKETEE